MHGTNIKIMIIRLLAVTENRGCIVCLGPDVKSIFSTTYCSQMRLISILEELSTNKYLVRDHGISISVSQRDIYS
jgi:hypothetical protein